MKYLGGNPLAKTALSLLAVGIMSFGVETLTASGHATKIKYGDGFNIDNLFF